MFSKLRKMILPMGILALGLLIAGCGGDSKKAEVPDLKELRITYVKAPLNIPSIVEKKQQSFEKAFPGVKLTFPEIASGAKQTEAMAAGELDIANALGGTSAILAAANGADVKILGIYSRAPKAFTIMVKDPSIQSVKDLKGKKIGGPKGTILHQVLFSALAAEGMSAEDVEFVNMDIPPAVAALQSGSLDAALVAGPGVYQATQNGARILKTGEGLVDAIIVIGVRGEFVKKHPSAAAKFMQVHREVLSFIKTNQAEAFKMTAEETGLSPEGVAAMASWYDFDPAVRPSDIEDLKKTQDFMIANGMLPKEKAIDIEKLFVK